MTFFCRTIKIHALFLFVFISSEICAQTENILVIDKEYSELNHLGRTDDQLIYTISTFSSTQVRKVDLETREDIILRTVSSVTETSEHSDNGFFYISYYSYGASSLGVHFLNFIDADGNQSEEINIGFYETESDNGLRVSYAVLLNDKFYVKTFFEDKYCVWESDGTLEGTQIIFESEFPILALEKLNETLVIVQSGLEAYSIYNYTEGSTFTLSYEVPTLEIATSFQVVGSDEEFLYFNGTDSNSTINIYRFNLETSPEVFTQIDCKSIRFYENQFEVTVNAPSGIGGYLVVGSLQDPTVLDTVSFNDAHLNGIFYKSHGDGYHSIFSIDQGAELATINSENQFEIIETSSPGAASGHLLESYGNHFQYRGFSRSYLSAEDGNNYAILSNGVDSKYYVTRIGESEETLFPLGFSEEATLASVHENYIYWFEEFKDTYELKRRNLNGSLEPQPESNPEHEEWYRQLAATVCPCENLLENMRFNRQGIKLDSEDNVIMGVSTGQMVNRLTMYGSASSEKIEPKGQSTYVKYNKYGELQWVQTLGNKYSHEARDDKFTVKPNGNIVVLGKFSFNGVFEDETLETEVRAVFLAEIEGNTGEILWKKAISENSNSNWLTLGLVEADSQGQIYIAYSVSGNSVELDGEVLSSNGIRTPGVAKFDSTGNLIWQRTITTPWVDVLSKNTVFELNEDSNELMVVQSQGGYNTTSSCEYRDWSYNIVSLDLDGNVTDQRVLTSTDIGGLTTGTYTQDGGFISLGYYRGQMNAGPYTAQTEPGEYCNITEGFSVSLDRSLNISRLNQTVGGGFFPLNVKAHDGHLYVVGTTENWELILIKMTSQGLFVGYKPLGQRHNPYDEFQPVYLDVNNDHIVVLGSDFREYEDLEIRNMINHMQFASILKLENKNWQTDLTWFKNSNIESAEENDILVYPNPFESHVNVVFSNENHSYTNYEIHNTRGELLSKGKVEKSTIYQIGISDLAAGIYILNLTGEKESRAIQILKN